MGVSRIRTRTLEHDHALTRHLDRLRLELAGAHVELEELASGDAVEPEEVRGSLDRAGQALASIADAAEAGKARELAGGRQEVERLFERVRELTERRIAGHAAGEAVGAGTPLEGTFDREMDALLAAAGRLGAAAERHLEEHRRRTDLLQAAVLGCWGAIVVLAAAGAWAYGRRRNEAERRLLESQRRLHLVQKMDAVGKLAGGIAHDVNNYLAAIRAQTELVLHCELTPEERTTALETVVGTVLRASSLVERLLTFGRRQPARPESIDLNAVVEGLERMMLGSLGPEVSLETRLAPELWPVEVDLAQMEQTVTNLFVNARDAVGERGTIRIETTNRPGAARSGSGDGGAPGDQVELTVTDDGRGIPPEALDRLFEPFFTTKDGVGSSGLGLATVYAALEQAGGTIEVESEVGGGAAFRVLLPRAGGDPAARAVVPRGQRDVRGSERILLVEDNAELRRAVEKLLASLGYRVTAAAGPEAALEAVETAETPFDLVIADVQLPAMAGPDLVARVRRKAPVKALYMSGYTERIALRPGSAPGEAYFVKKPFSAPGMARMVRELLDAEPAPADERG